MKRIRASAMCVPLLFILSSAAVAQTSSEKLVERKISAIDYRVRGESPTVDFMATPLLPNAAGQAKVSVNKGYAQIEAEFDHLVPATQYGPEYLTYVLWAISPEEPPENLGEIQLTEGKGSLTAMRSLNAFGLIVTAEPYSAVTRPNDVVVLEHFIPAERTFIPIETRYELVVRGQYATGALPADLKSNPFGDEIPLGLREAWNAIRIARWSGANQYAADLYANAQELLHQAELSRKQRQLKLMAMLARQAAQAAEGSRLFSLKRLEEIRLTAQIKAVAIGPPPEREAVEQTKAEEVSKALVGTASK